MCPRNSSFEHIGISDYAINGLFFTTTSWAKTCSDPTSKLTQGKSNSD